MDRRHDGQDAGGKGYEQVMHSSFVTERERERERNAERPRKIRFLAFDVVHRNDDDRQSLVFSRRAHLVLLVLLLMWTYRF